jgi:hypothetical protein
VTVEMAFTSCIDPRIWRDHPAFKGVMKNDKFLHTEPGIALTGKLWKK